MSDTDKYKSKRQNLIHNYLALLLKSFIEAGIVEALIELGNEYVYKLPLPVFTFTYHTYN